MACTKSFNLPMPAATVALAVVAFLSGTKCECADRDRSSFSLQGDKELNLDQTCDTRKQHVRISSDYFFVSLSEDHILIVAQAPQWTVRVISVPRKLYADVAFKEWLRRGPPTNFLHLTSLPAWPCVQTGDVQYLKLPATKFAMPYMLKGKAAPLDKGVCGELLSICHGVPPEAGQIIERCYQTPINTGFPLLLRVWDFENYHGKANPLLVYSGGNSDDSFHLTTTKAWIGKRQPLPSVAGFRAAKDLTEVWVSQSQMKEFGELLR